MEVGVKLAQIWLRQNEYVKVITSLNELAQNHPLHEEIHFSLRTKVKVNIQWQLFCIVHNIGKIACSVGLVM